MTIKLKDTRRLIHADGVGERCLDNFPERFKVAVEVATCTICEPERFRFLKEHQIHDTCPPERWPTPVELAALTQAVGMMLDELGVYGEKASEMAGLRGTCAKVLSSCANDELLNIVRLGHVRANLQTIRDGLEQVACRS
jgi:hypothetical protein